MNEVAIIGMSGRFPGAKNVRQFYENLWTGVESITFLTEEQLIAKGVARETLSNPFYVKATAQLPEAEYFDAEFFKYSAREARILDPQQRCFLECAWEALEDAGYSQESYSIPVGVFAGASANTYILNNLLSGRVDLNLNFMDFVETRQGSDKDFIATRVSYKLNLTGPSFTIQSACSTSLVAVHTACQSLLNGECDLALAGAVTVLYPLDEGYMHKPNSMVSPDGHCRTFSASAQGTIFGSGVGVVILKRLEDALQDNDNILAAIKGSAINNDGALKPSYTAPSMDKQAEVIGEALAIANVSPESIGYIEAHGTGTPIGDPVEVAALTQAFQEYTDRKQYCAIGSVKTNIGHLDVAAGMAGLIKTVLILKHKQIPPTLHFDRPNPKIDFLNSPFYVNTQLKAFASGDTPRRAGITSLGVGGTNVHMILEEAPEIESVQTQKPQVLLVSAKTESAFCKARENLRDYLRTNPVINLADVAYTTQVGRIRFPIAQAFVCRNIEEAWQQLNTTKAVIPQSFDGNTVNVCFVLADFKRDHARNLWSLSKTQAVFQDAFNECIESWNSLLTEIDRDGQKLDQALIQKWAKSKKSGVTLLSAQVITFSLQYALTRLLMDWGITPQALVTSGTGELVGACIAGVINPSIALALLGLHHSQLDTAVYGLVEKRLQARFAIEPTIPLYICGHEEWLSEGGHKPDYWLNRRKADAQQATVLTADISNTVNLLIGSPNSQTATESQNHILNLIDTSEVNDLDDRLLHIVATLWTTGVSIAWNKLHTGEPRRRIPLPTYPFERKCYRYEQPEIIVSKALAPAAPAHPLLHNSIHSPEIGKSLFECNMDLHNFPYLDDHRVFGLAIVPGSFHISIALSAASQIYGDIPIGIESLIFGKALFIEQAHSRKVQLVIDIRSSDRNLAQYKLMSCESGKQLEAHAWHTHSQGYILSNIKRLKPQTLDIDEILSRCPKQISHDVFYQNGWEKGFEWQGDFRSLRRMWQGDGEALALLEYSSGLQQSIDDYSIHPAILDACLQPYLLTLSPNLTNSEPYIPLSIDKMVFYKKPTAKLWIHTRLCEADSQTKDSFAIDLNIYDEHRQPIMHIECLRVIRMPKHQLVQVADELFAQKWDFIYKPQWQLVPPVTADAVNAARDVVIVAHSQDQWGLSDKLAEYHSQANIIKITLGNRFVQHTDTHIEINHLQPADYQRVVSSIPASSTVYFLGGLAIADANHAELDILEHTQSLGVLALFHLSQALIVASQHKTYQLKIITNDLHHVSEADQQLYPFAGGLIGFAKVLARENPQIAISCIDLSSADLNAILNSSKPSQPLMAALAQEPGNVNVREVALRNHGRFIKQLVQYTSLVAEESQTVFRHKGVYLILGGAGGIGIAVSRYLAEKYQARLVWIGRRPQDQAITQSITTIQKYGGDAIYLQADATDLTQMEAVYQQVKSTFGNLHGAIHSALVLRDQSVMKMTLSDFQAAFDIKVKATVVLEQITRDVPLDFIAFFSSENAWRGWHGLCNYVAGCTFKDNYAHYLRHTKQRPVKIFNWGFWGEVGIAAQENIRDLVQKQGISPISTVQGLAIFDTVLNQSVTQVVPTKINPEINSYLGVNADLTTNRVQTMIPSAMSNIKSHINNFIHSYQRQNDNQPWLDMLLHIVRHQTLRLFQDLGVNTATGQLFRRQDMITEFGIAQKFGSLIAAMEDILCQADFLQRVNSDLIFTNKAQKKALQEIRRYSLQRNEIISNYPQSASWFRLLDTALNSFIPIIKGEVKATDILFPNSSIELVESIYQGNCMSDYFNQLVRETVMSQIQHLAEQNNRKISILEFGAGTGSTTRLLLDSLKADGDHINYVFTDVSQHFTNKAKQELGIDYPFVTFQTFDMEKSPQQQGLSLGTFDIVLGTNVIHVCADIWSTVGRLKTLLKENGLFILNELTHINDVWTLTFGLLDGWWLAEDKYLRLQHTPLLSPDNWRELLQAQGFRQINLFTQLQISDVSRALQCLIVSESDGYITLPTVNVPATKANAKTALTVATTATTKTQLAFSDVESVSVQERYGFLERYMQHQVAKSLEIERPSDIPLDEPIGDLGMDSLIVLDFCNALSKDIGRPIPTTMVFDYPTLAKMSTYIANQILNWQLTNESEGSANKISQSLGLVNLKDLNNEIDNLSQDDIEALLAAELES